MQAIFDAGEGKLGTDESKFITILAAQSHEQLRAVFRAYNQISNRTLLKAISSEMSGDLENGMLAVGKCLDTSLGRTALSF